MFHFYGSIFLKMKLRIWLLLIAVPFSIILCKEKLQSSFCSYELFSSSGDKKKMACITFSKLTDYCLRSMTLSNGFY